MDPAILPAEYGGRVSTAECIRSWRAELEDSRAALLDLDLLKVEAGPGSAGEHAGVVRKKSRHDSDSGSQVLGVMGSVRKHEMQAEREQ